MEYRSHSYSPDSGTQSMILVVCLRLGPVRGGYENVESVKGIEMGLELIFGLEVVRIDLVFYLYHPKGGVEK
jgi:hypothetical protein